MPILSFFTSGLARWLVLAVVLVAVVLMARLHWKQEGREEILRENAAAAVRIITRQGEATERVVTKYRTIVKQAEPIVQTIEKEVIRYANVNPGFCLDADWRRLHDAGALGAVPAAAGGIDAAGRTPEAPPAAVALQTVTDNYAACRRTAARLDGLQDWVREQQQVR
jgi:hypothetical protein